MPSVFWEYVLSPTRSGVLSALDCALRDSNSTSTSGSNAKRNVFDALSAQQKDTLRLYIATVEPLRQLTGMHTNIYSFIAVLLFIYEEFVCSILFCFAFCIFLVFVLQVICLLQALRDGKNHCF